MRPEIRLASWIGILAALVIVLWALGDILAPFVAGVLIAYFLDPVAARLQRWGCSRGAATLVITAVFFVAAAAAALTLFPLIQAQMVGFAARVPAYLEALGAAAGPHLARLRASLPAEAQERLAALAGANAGWGLVGWLGELLKGLWSGGAAILDLLGLALITPPVAFYALRDWDRIVAGADGLLPRDAAPTIRREVAEVDRVLAAFVRGQATVCLILAALYAAALMAIGLEFGLLVGVGAGLISFIPVVGLLVGLGAALAIALMQFAEPLPIVLTAGVFACGQILEAQVLTPRLVGRRVGLHPLSVVFALLAGGALFGFAGVLVAVPAAAAVGVVVRFLIRRYQQSALYRGSGGGPPP